MNKKIIAFVVSAFLSVSAMAADQKGQGSKHINVNQATVEELDKGLLGVGPRIAMEIVKHRDQHGPYQDFDDLDKVKYVGSRMLDKNKGRIVFD
ncbi:ComEA family DNA-binding protein [Endozoicomonas sp.]|uniref:ComEA family DNA-binding protein n=1 Tax=Endozoicomonas sp. TaxID=1892382 RepID=UPI003AF6A505